MLPLYSYAGVTAINPRPHAAIHVDSHCLGRVFGRVQIRPSLGPLSTSSSHRCTRTLSVMATAALSALGYAGFGFLARCYALGIQKRNIFDSMCGFVSFNLPQTLPVMSCLPAVLA